MLVKKPACSSSVLLSIILLSVILCLPGVAESGSMVKVQILSINDFHGQLEAPLGLDGRMSLTEDPQQQDLGGAEYLSTTLTQLRQSAKHSVTVTAGDLIGAAPLLSGLFHNEPTVEAFEALKLDVSSVGNHEFDEGLTELLRMQYGGCHPDDGCYFPDWPYDGANFPWLAANVLWSRTGKSVLPQTWVKEVDGVKLGFIGMTLSGTPALVSQTGIQGLRFEEEVMAANRAVMTLRKQKVRAIVLLLHEGGAQTSTYDGCEGISGPISDLAKKLPAEIDLIISGHTHRAYICQLQDPNGKLRPVTSASAYGRAVTETWLTIDTRSRDVIRSKSVSKNVPVVRTVGRDPAITAIIDKWYPLYLPKANQKAGLITADITTSPGRDKPSSLANLVADSMLRATQKPPYNADIALINQGGIRANLSWKPATATQEAGTLTYSDLYKVLPFGNTIVTVSLTGDQIRQALEQQYDPLRSRPELILGVSAGLEFDYLTQGAQGSRVQNIRLNGTTLDPTKNYQVTLGDFLAVGGDSFTAFKGGKNLLGAGSDLEALTSYLMANSPLPPPSKDRIRLIGP